MKPATATPRPHVRPFGILALVVLALGILVFLRINVPHVASASAGTDWSTLAHDARRTGSTATGPVGPFTKQWYRDFWSESGEQVATGYQPVIVHDATHNLDLVYVATMSGALYALDLSTGSTFWRYPAPGQTGGGILSSPTINNGIIYLASLDGRVYALDGSNITNGVPSIKWTFATGRPGGFSTTPVFSTDTNRLYIGGRDGYFYALDAASGIEQWEYHVGAPILTSPAYDQGVVYFGAEDMHGYALNATGGSLVWQSPQLTGKTLQGYYPVLTNSLILFRTTPNDDPQFPRNEGEQDLAFAQGCSSYPLIPANDRSNVPCFNWNATASSPASYAQEAQAIQSYLAGSGYNGLPGRPQYETFFAMNRSTGTKAFFSPVLYTGALGYPAVPPAVDQNGNLWVLYRSYFSGYDNPSTSIFGTFGQMDQSNGSITIRNPTTSPTGYSCTSTSCNPWFATNVWMIGDETTAFSIAGNYLYTNQWSGVGIVNLTTGDLQSVIGERDAFASALVGGAARVYPYGMDPESHGQPNGPPIYGDSIIVNYNSVVAAMRGHIPGTASTPQPTSTPHPLQSLTPTTANAITIPPSSALQNYIWQVPVATNVNATASADLQATLNTQVSSFLSQGRMAPWILAPGNNSIYGYFLTPADTMYYLGLAYPYLSPTLQSQVKAFVSNEQTLYNPLTANYPWNDGLTYTSGQVIEDPARQRVPFPLGPRDYCTLQGCEGNFPQANGYLATPNPFDRLYEVWTYAYRSGDWSWLQANWASIQSNYSFQQTVSAINNAMSTSNDDALLGLPTTPTNVSGRNGLGFDSANRRLAALIAYTRIAYHLDDSSNTTWGINATTAALQARLRYVNNFRPSDGNGSDPSTSTWWSSNGNDGGLFLQTKGWNDNNIPEFRDLTPEVAHLLADYASDDFARYDRFLATALPSLYLQQGPSPFDNGETMYAPAHELQGAFLDHALVARMSGPQLRTYLDIPWVKEDYFYWERLVRTIDGYGALEFADTRYPSQPPSPQPYQITFNVTK